MSISLEEFARAQLITTTYFKSKTRHNKHPPLTRTEYSLIKELLQNERFAMNPRHTNLVKKMKELVNAHRLKFETKEPYPSVKELESLDANPGE